MQGGRGGRDPFYNFGDPFGSLGRMGFPGTNNPRSFISSFFGGSNPFDDPFFTRPYGGMFESPFGTDPFNPVRSSMSFIDDQPSEPKRTRGLKIEELNSEDEEDENTEENPKRHRRINIDPRVEFPNEDNTYVNEGRQVEPSSKFHRVNERGSRSGPQVFSFQSSSVTYGGPNGAYYTSSSTRRTGSDGFTLEESKEANTTTGQAAHRISKGLHNKGHSVTRKLRADGGVNTTQTLHNLNEDEISKFEESWNGKAKSQLPGWSPSFGSLMNREEQLALPSTENRYPGGDIAGPSNIQPSLGAGYKDYKRESVNKLRGKS